MKWTLVIVIQFVLIQLTMNGTLASPQSQEFFTSSSTIEELQGKQAVIETVAGTIVVDLLAEAAPNHVGHFIFKAREGAYDGTVFHRIISMGIIQGGDPISNNPQQQADYGTGGLGVLQFEPNSESHTRGAVSAVLVPNDRDSAGSQFFICVTDQIALDGQYTVFGRVVEGIATAQKLSTSPADSNGAPIKRLEINKVTIREASSFRPKLFVTETVAMLQEYRVRIETSMGAIIVELFPDRAPNHVRNFLRLSSAGIYNGTAFHRVAKDFVIQGGHMPSRLEPLEVPQEQLIQSLEPEFNETPHDMGILSMARLEDPASATTSFFIVTGRSQGLDGLYTVFGRVVGGLDVVERIENVPVNGETPVERVAVRRVVVISP
mgnify:CR=1 FL=1